MPDRFERGGEFLLVEYRAVFCDDTRRDHRFFFSAGDDALFIFFKQHRAHAPVRDLHADDLFNRIKKLGEVHVIFLSTILELFYH